VKAHAQGSLNVFFLGSLCVMAQGGVRVVVGKKRSVHSNDVLSNKMLNYYYKPLARRMQIKSKKTHEMCGTAHRTQDKKAALQANHPQSSL
jgi:hypothetical protein